jgi:hypothetical protein
MRGRPRMLAEAPAFAGAPSAIVDPDGPDDVEPTLAL